MALNYLKHDEDALRNLHNFLLDIHDKRQAAVDRERKTLKSRLTQLMNERNNVYRRSIADDLPADEIKHAIDDINKDIDSVEKELQQLSLDDKDFIDRGIDTLTMYNTFPELYSSLSEVKKREMCRILFRTITATGTDFPIPTRQPFYFEWNEPFKTLLENKFEEIAKEIDAESSEIAEETEKWLPKGDNYRNKPLCFY